MAGKIPSRAVLEEEVREVMDNVQGDVDFVNRVVQRFSEVGNSTTLEGLPLFLENGKLHHETAAKLLGELADRAKVEGTFSLEEAKEIKKLLRKRKIKQQEVEELKLEKKEEVLGSEQWDAIFAMRSELLEYPEMATAFFDTQFLEKLGDRFDERFDLLNEDVRDLRTEFEEAIKNAAADVKEYIDRGDFNDRIMNVLRLIQNRQTRQEELSKESEELLELEKNDIQKALDRLKLDNGAEMDGLRGNLDQAKEEAKDLSAKLDRQTKRAEKAEKARSLASEGHRKAEEDANDQVKALESSIQDLQKRLSQAQEAEERGATQVTRLSSDFKSLEAARDRATKQADEAKEQLESLRTSDNLEFQRLDTIILGLEGDVRKAQGAETRADGRAIGLSANLRDAETARDSATYRAEEAKKHHESLLEKKNDEIKTLDTKVQDLERELGEAQEAEKSAAGRASRLSSELKDAETARDLAAKEADEAKKTHESLYKAKCDEAEALKNKVQNLERCLSESQQKYLAEEARAVNNNNAWYEMREAMEDEKHGRIVAERELKENEEEYTAAKKYLQEQLQDETKRADEAEQRTSGLREQNQEDAVTIGDLQEHLQDETKRADETVQELSELREQQARDDNSRQELGNKVEDLRQAKDQLWDGFNILKDQRDGVTILKDNLSKQLEQSKDKAAKAEEDLATKLRKARDETAEVEKTLQVSREALQASQRKAKEDDLSSRGKIQELKGTAAKEAQTLAGVEVQRDEVQQQLSILVQTNGIRSKAISRRPVGELISILERSTVYGEDISAVDSTRTLNSSNSDLPEGTHLIADTLPGAWILLVSGIVCVFDAEDIHQVRRKPFGEITLDLKEDSGIPNQMRVLTIRKDYGKSKAEWVMELLGDKVVQG